MNEVKQLFERRKRRNRFKIAKVSTNRPRLSVFRSNQHIYAQVIDDNQHCTVVAASTLDKELAKILKATSDVKAAQEVGKLVAARAVKAGIKDVVFDRGGYIYHGRVKALAESARENGLSF